MLAAILGTVVLIFLDNGNTWVRCGYPSLNNLPPNLVFVLGIFFPYGALYHGGTMPFPEGSAMDLTGLDSSPILSFSCHFPQWRSYTLFVMSTDITNFAKHT